MKYVLSVFFAMMLVPVLFAGVNRVYQVDGINATFTTTTVEDRVYSYEELVTEKARYEAIITKNEANIANCQAKWNEDSAYYQALIDEIDAFLPDIEDAQKAEFGINWADRIE